MSGEQSMPKRADPRASRPYMPGYGILDAASGKGLLPWSWASERLAKAGMPSTSGSSIQAWGRSLLHFLALSSV